MSHSNNKLTHLGDMPIETFLKDYWQKKPLLIRNAFPNVHVIDANEIAGFALEPEVESRILIETPSANQPLNSQWSLLHGPQQEATFESLPKSNWTLLVQAVDQLVPEVQQLLHKFRFIPNWRVDDIMVSYASDQGNVGPHFDYYDVFLLQAQGSRLWHLGDMCSASTPLRKDTDCKILTEFNTTEQWLVNPGDMLYIPPKLAHWGLAQGECITYSVGFRAPSYSEVLLDYTQELAACTTEDQRYTDTNLKPRTNSGEILADDIQRLKKIILEQASNEEQLTEWFGRYMTQSRRDSLMYEDESDQITQGYLLAANCRGAFSQQTNSCSVKLFLNGEVYICSLPLAEAICGYSPILTDRFSGNDQSLIEQLLADEILV